jgi:Phosphatidylinositol 3- and 4-kinase
LVDSKHTLEEYGIKDGAVLDLVHYESTGRNKEYLIELKSQLSQTKEAKDGYKHLRRAIGALMTAFSNGINPERSEESGTSGSYFLRDTEKRRLAIFKPFDEEPFAPNNPNDFTGKMGSVSFRKGVLSGELAYREVFAYSLDQSHPTKPGHHFVPETGLVNFKHPFFTKAKNLPVRKPGEPKKRMTKKFGSIQLMIPCNGSAEDYSYTKYPDEEVRKIGILDIRILNCDRNDGNILVQR